jgi:hypothetical protein
MALLTQTEALKASGLTKDQFDRCVSRGLLRRFTLTYRKTMFSDDEVDAIKILSRMETNTI